MDIDMYLEGSELLYSILNGNISEVKVHLEQGGDSNRSLSYKYEFFSPVRKKVKLLEESRTLTEIAISKKHYDILELLVDYGADVSSMIFDAIRTNDEHMIKLVVKLGAKLNFIDHVGKTAYDVACYENNLNTVKLLKELCLSVGEYAGKTFRRSASDGNLEFVEFFFNNGVDINYNKPDMVFPYASTAVIEATRSNHFHVVKWLIENGADISLVDKYGERPYTCAVGVKNEEMKTYIRELEPVELHTLSDKLESLKNYKMPKKMIEFLQREDRRIIIDNCKHINFIDFHNVLNSIEVDWNNRKFIDLVSDADAYGGGGFLVWYPKARKLATADYEHSEFKILDSWNSFIKNPSATINKMFE